MVIEVGTILAGNTETLVEKLYFVSILKAQSSTSEPLAETPPLCVRPSTISWCVKASPSSLLLPKSPARFPVR